MNNQQVNAFSNLKINEHAGNQKRPLNSESHHDNLISNSSISPSLNSSLNLNSNQPTGCPWNYDSGIQTGMHTKMPNSQANSCTGRDDEMDTICSLSQNSNLIEETAIAANHIPNVGLIDDQTNYVQEFSNINSSVNSNRLNNHLNNNYLDNNHPDNINLDNNHLIDLNSQPSRKIRGPTNSFPNGGRHEPVGMNAPPLSQQNNFQNNKPQSPMSSFGFQASSNGQPMNNLSHSHQFSQNYPMGNHAQQAPFAARPSSSSQASPFISGQAGHLNQPNVRPVPNPVPNPPVRNQQLQLNIENPERVREDMAGLIDLLNDDDPVVITKAIRIVYQLFQEENHGKILMTSNDLVRTMVRLANVFNEKEILKPIVYIFYNFSFSRSGLQMIFQNDVIPTLCKLLRETNEKDILECSMPTLHYLVKNQDGAKIAICRANGIPILVRMLARTESKFLMIVIDCLLLLTYQNQENKEILLECGGTQELIRILNTYEYPKLVWFVIRVLKVLSVCPKNKPVIIQFGGMHALTKTLRLSQDERLTNRIVFYSLWTIRNLSDAATSLNNLQGLLQCILCLLNDKDFHKALPATQILANLTCNNPLNKHFVIAAGGLNMLLESLLNSGDRREEIIEPTLFALRHLTTSHQHADFCRNSIRLSLGSLQPIVKFLQPPSSWPVINACIKLIRNLALSKDNWKSLRETSTIQRLYQLLFKADQEIKRTCPTFSFENITGCSAEGVKMYEIIEGTLAALQALAIDPTNCALIIDQGFTAVCIGIVYNYQLESILRMAIGCLHELSKLPLG